MAILATKRHGYRCPSESKNTGGPSKASQKQVMHQPLGDPPQYLNIVELGCWHELKNEMPWLTAGDTAIVIMACRLRARLVLDTMGQQDYTMLCRLIVQLRGTSLPMDRTPRARDNRETSADDLEKDLFG